MESHSFANTPVFIHVHVLRVVVIVCVCVHARLQSEDPASHVHVCVTHLTHEADVN